MANRKTLCSTGTCLGITFLQTDPSSIQESERGRKRYPSTLSALHGFEKSAIAESYASLLVR